MENANIAVGSVKENAKADLFDLAVFLSVPLIWVSAFGVLAFGGASLLAGVRIFATLSDASLAAFRDDLLKGVLMVLGEMGCPNQHILTTLNCQTHVPKLEQHRHEVGQTTGTSRPGAATALTTHTHMQMHAHTDMHTHADAHAHAQTCTHTCTNTHTTQKGSTHTYTHHTQTHNTTFLLY